MRRKRDEMPGLMLRHGEPIDPEVLRTLEEALTRQSGEPVQILSAGVEVSKRRNWRDSVVNVALAFGTGAAADRAQHALEVADPWHGWPLAVVIGTSGTALVCMAGLAVAAWRWLTGQD